MRGSNIEQLIKGDVLSMWSAAGEGKPAGTLDE